MTFKINLKVLFQYEDAPYHPEQWVNGENRARLASLLFSKLLAIASSFALAHAFFENATSTSKLSIYDSIYFVECICYLYQLYQKKFWAHWNYCHSFLSLTV